MLKQMLLLSFVAFANADLQPDPSPGKFDSPSFKYFVRSDPYWSWLKKHIIYAPLFHVRHNREFRLSAAINFGTLPTRFQAALLIGIVAMNVTLCCVTIPFGAAEGELLAAVRARTGTIAVANIIPLVLMAGRNNPLIQLLDVSFDTWNLLHRWLGRIMVVEAVVHVIAWMVDKVHTSGWPSVSAAIVHSELIRTGFIRAIRFIRLAYLNLGKGGTTATVEILPGDAMRITLRMVRPWLFKPGQHLYLYLPGIGLWMSHPFTAAWSDTEESLVDGESLVSTKQDALTLKRPTVSLLVRRRTGLTILLVTAGVGITHQIPYVRHLVEGFANGTVAARRVTLVWIIQSSDHLEWVRSWMTSILNMDRRREVLRVMLFITRPRNMKEIQSPSRTVQMYPGKPDIGTVLDGEIENQVGAMGVLVCGTGSLSDDVRKACRERQSPTHIDFVEECFTW
ncbi:conserved hypothetical protein [Uncinocarpus reesii 1704]|uniref:ferric-chelate reductase (NADPH) n=1 Tax=Uncinocarpus reesii (strain UAMH 1704) TaxID=336963 RepID=C4JZB5_UNCRE|nr:uncharacterized protein UREG_07516 [Uncinocarpus reesii 1704]EEP82651.1 conserved hypothetical protein [Uncinocarpus reesii 1704]